MKKTIAILLMLCLCIGLCACRAVDSLADRLQRDEYSVVAVTDDEMNSWAERQELDVNQYGVKSMALGTHKTEGVTVYIIECDSNNNASALVNVLKEKVTAENNDCVLDGNCVLFGDKGAISVALGK